MAAFGVGLWVLVKRLGHGRESTARQGPAEGFGWVNLSQKSPESQLAGLDPLQMQGPRPVGA